MLGPFNTLTSTSDGDSHGPVRLARDIHSWAEQTDGWHEDGDRRLRLLLQKFQSSLPSPAHDGILWSSSYCMYNLHNQYTDLEAY